MYSLYISADEMRVRNCSAIEVAYVEALQSAESLMRCVGTFHITIGELDVAMHQAWRSREASSYARYVLNDFPLLPALVSPKSDAVSWLLLSAHGNGITAPDETSTTANIDLRVFDEFFNRLARCMAPTVRRLGLDPQQLMEINSHLNDVRHRLLRSAQEVR